MPASRTDSKSPRIRRREQGSPVVDGGSNFDDITTPLTTNILTDEQIKLRAMIPAITPAHGPESTSSAILAALSLGNHRPNSHTRRKSDGHVNRPPNAFIVFRRAQVQNMPANVTQHQQRISNLTALFWRVLTHSEQNTWYALSDDIKKLHSILFPDYNFNPRNPDGSKKAMLPRAGLTSERLDFAWSEAQLLIQKHTTMVEHPVAAPASSTGKLPRPKPPRKGQGTRAKERREKEAAERAAAAAQSTANEAAAFSDEDLGYIAEHQPNGAFDSRSYFSTIEEESSAPSPNDVAIAWRPDFNLDGSVSSRSSPSANSWTELVGPLDSNAEFVDPLDSGYPLQNGYEANQLNGQVDYNMGQYAAPYPTGLIFANSNPQPVPTSFVSVQKHENSYGVNYAPDNSNVHPQQFASYYEPHGPLHSATVMHSNEFMQNQSEAQYVFHDMDPATNYIDGPVYATGMPTEYIW